MLSFLYRLLVGSFCKHKWKILRETDIYKGNGADGELPTALQYDLQCEKCGDIVRRRR